MNNTIGWVNDLNKNLKETLANEAKYIKIPEGGKVDFMLRLQEPKKVLSEKYGTDNYEWIASDGKVLTASRKLSLEITEALKPLLEKITSTETTDVCIEIQNKGIKNKPIYAVFIRAGV